MANDVIQLEVLTSSGGEGASNILHFEVGTGSGSSIMDELSACIAGFRSNIESAYMDCLSTDCDLLGYKARFVNNGGSPTMAVPVSGVSGTVAHPTVASGAGACLLPYYSDPATSKFRTGRVFLPSAPETYIRDNVLQTAYMTAVDALRVQLEAGFSDSGKDFSWVVWSRKGHIAIGPLVVEISAKVGIQRRRQLPTF